MKSRTTLRARSVAIGEFRTRDSCSPLTFRSTLLDVSSYEWDSVKGCIPTPGVRIQFKKGVEVVDVLFCFECDILAVCYNGVMVGGKDFDNARGTLLSVVKELFPDDLAIQQL